MYVRIIYTDKCDVLKIGIAMVMRDKFLIEYIMQIIYGE